VPAHLLLVNPSRPRKSLKRRSSGGARRFTPAQLAAQARFRTMVKARATKKNPSNKPRKRRQKGTPLRHVGPVGTAKWAGAQPSFLGGRAQAAEKKRRRVARRPSASAKDLAAYKRAFASLDASGGVTKPKRRRKKAASKTPSRQTRRKKPAAKTASRSTMSKKRRKGKGRRKSSKKRAAARRTTKVSSATKSTGTKKRRKSSKRSRAAKKAARTRARRRRNKVSKRQRALEIRMGNSMPRRRRKKRKAPGAQRRRVKQLVTRARSLRKRAKGKKGAGASIMRVRARAMSLHARSLGRRRKGSKSGLSSANKRMLRAHGLLKVNPSFSAIVKDMAVLLPEAGFTVAGLAGAAIGSTKLVNMLRTKMPSIPGIQSVHAPAVVSVLLGAAGYVGLRMAGAKSAMLGKAASSVFIGGLAAAVVHTLAAVKVKDAAGEVSLGKKLGLPLGDYVVGDYVVGDYVVGAMPGAQGVVDVDGNRVRVNGLGSIFADRTLGALPDSREGARGTRFEPHMREILDVDEGSLAGSIFD